MNCSNNPYFKILLVQKIPKNNQHKTDIELQILWDNSLKWRKRDNLYLFCLKAFITHPTVVYELNAIRKC